MSTKFLNQVQLTGTVTPSNTAIATGDDGQTTAQKLQGQINNINSTSSSAYAVDIVGGAANDIPYQTAANVTSFITPVNSAVLVSNSSGVPSMSTTLPGVNSGATLVTDPTTSSPATLNTALSDVLAAVPAKATNIAAGVANDIPYQTAANTTSFIAPVNSAVLVSSVSGVPSMSTTLPAVAIGSCTVTDPTTSSSASINTALSDVLAAVPAKATNIAAGVANDIPYQTAANTTSFIAPANSSVLISSIAGVPSMSATLPLTVQGNITETGALASGSLATGFTAVTVPLGGTGLTTLTTPNGVVCAGTTATGSLQNTGTGSNGQVLTSNGTAIPTWQNTGSATNATNVSNGAANDILYQTAASTTGFITPVNSAVLISSAAGVPSMSTTLPTAVQANITETGTITTGVWNGSVIPLAYGGTNANLTASNGGIFYSNGTSGAILSGTATADQLLLSGSSTTPSWSTSTYPTTNAINTLLYASAANTINALATADSAVLVTSASGVPSLGTTLPAVAIGSCTVTDPTTSSSASINTALSDVYAAIAANFSINIQTFTSSGTYTPHANMVYCTIECWGAGGGGGGGVITALAYYVSAPGGGAGGYSRKTATKATIGASQVITIGVGGTGVSAAAGNNGTATSVGSICIANGGTGGPSVAGAGGAGGTAGTGDVTGVGQNGFTGIYTFGAQQFFVCGTAGGSTLVGSGCSTTYQNNSSINGANATGYGAGGGGSAYSNIVANNAGGSGAPGYVVITEYVII